MYVRKCYQNIKAKYIRIKNMIQFCIKLKTTFKYQDFKNHAEGCRSMASNAAILR